MVSNWYLYIGIFFTCTGVLTIPGIIMIVYYFYHHFMENGIKVKPEKGTWSGNLQDQAEDAERVINQYNFKGNITDLHEKEKYT
mgnify:CR=1 FL=1